MSNDPYFLASEARRLAAAFGIDAAQTARDRTVVYVTDGTTHRFGFAEQMAALDAKMGAALVVQGDDPVTPRQAAHERAVRVLGPKRGRWK